VSNSRTAGFSMVTDRRPRLYEIFFIK
jgi:hypothetical protein